MTYVTTNANISSIRSALGTFGAAIARRVEASADARVSPRRRQIEKLESKSDAELAQMGLKRDQISYYVFQDLFYS